MSILFFLVSKCRHLLQQGHYVNPDRQLKWMGCCVFGSSLSRSSIETEGTVCVMSILKLIVGSRFLIKNEIKARLPPLKLFYVGLLLYTLNFNCTVSKYHFKVRYVCVNADWQSKGLMGSIYRQFPCVIIINSIWIYTASQHKNIPGFYERCYLCFKIGTFCFLHNKSIMEKTM